MKFWKKIVLALAAVFVICQFFRPEKNLGSSSEYAIAQHFTVPPSVQTVLQRSCYDCHSDHTVYPWYAGVMPVGWLLAKDVRNGKRALNFDEYASYRLIKQYGRFQDITDQIQDDNMPLSTYLLMHGYAKLSQSEKKELIEWCAAMQDTMKANFPVDSLKRKPRR